MPKKSLGQHFLSDPSILERIVAFSGVGPDDAIVEVGSGRGTLTRVLAAHARQVVAIEIDPDLVPALRRELPNNTTVIEADALGIDFRTVAGAGYHVVANLPYNVATPLIERFVAARSAIASVTVLLQKEVADRILAHAGTRDYGALSVGVQYYADVDRGFVVEPGAFRPPPNVRSRVVRMRWKPDVEDDPAFIGFVRGAFAQRRKTLANNLAAMDPGLEREAILGAIDAIGHPDDVRAERIPVPEFGRLFRLLARARPS